MCLEENYVKPIGNKFYKLFLKRGDQLFWPLRTANGHLPEPLQDEEFGKSPVAKGVLTSSDHGFCVWKDKESAVSFAKYITTVLYDKFLNGLDKGESFVVKEVVCSDYLRSGMSVCALKRGGSIWDDKTKVKAQAFAFKHIEVC